MFKDLKGKRYFLREAPIEAPPREGVMLDREYNLRLPPLSSEPIYLGRLKDGTNTNGVVVCLNTLEIDIEEANIAEIVRIFLFMHPNKNILRSVDDIVIVDLYGRKEARKKAYTDIIQPPIFSIDEGIRKIMFWVMSWWWECNLEEWVISQDSQGERRIERKVLEYDL